MLARQVLYHLSHSTSLRIFFLYHEGVFNFIKYLFCIYWYECNSFVLFLLICYITFIFFGSTGVWLRILCLLGKYLSTSAMPPALLL
jgi:hypothetical protein